jgi:hypothetical protein
MDATRPTDVQLGKRAEEVLLYVESGRGLKARHQVDPCGVGNG